MPERGRRCSRVVAVLFSAAVVAAAAVVPSASGQSERSITIYRDAFGVPHVEAGDALGIAYGTGYALAQDRPFLTIAIRLTGQGRSAELLGDPALEADEVMRRDFYEAADVQRQYEALPAEVKAELEAFSDGFNRGFTEVMADPARRPALFDALGHTPEPWKPTDSLAVTMLFTYAVFAGEGGAGQLGNAELLARLEDRFGTRAGRTAWDGLVSKHDPRAPTVVPRGDERAAPRSIREERPGAAQLAAARAFAPALARTQRAIRSQELRVQEILRRLPLPKIGSYAIGLSGSLTKSGGGALIGSPQAGLTAPPVFWQVGQHAPGRECTGFTVPGLGPWTGIGWCNGHTWSLVAGNMGEQVDNYVERVDPENPRRYFHRGEWRDMTIRRETFAVNRCTPPVCEDASPPRTVMVEIEETVHGPVVARDEEAGIAITTRRAQRGRWVESLLAVKGWNEAHSLREFELATDRATGTYNLVYADREGHTMYRFTGFQPTRARGVDRRLPTPGDGSLEWRGVLPQRAMPRVVDPRSGLVVANQGIESKPNAWWPNSSSVAVGQASRVAGNRRILLDGAPHDVASLEGLNPLLLERRDAITPIFERHLRRALVGSRDAGLREALQLLDEWADAGYPRVDGDGDGIYDHPALAIFGADNFNLPPGNYPRYLWEDLLRRVFADELQRDGGGSERGTFQQPGTYLARISTLKLALDGRRASRPLGRDFVDDIGTARRETAAELVESAVARTLTRLRFEFGTADMRRWLRPVPTVAFAALGAVAPPPIRGFDHGTYSQIVDPRAEVGRYILPPGNAAADSAGDIALGQLGRFPDHFADQREIYERYGFIDMPHAPERYRASSDVTRLSYAGPSRSSAGP
jgi:acyl-homoserine lactone acylase PvdQ